jgi:XRE family transcriptional regulator, thiamine biosynthesis regulator
MLSVFSSLVEDVYPALNAQISKCLIKKGIKQSTIASYLGITQAMVSKYAAKSHKINKELEKAITEFSEKVAQEIIDKVSKENIATLVTKQSLQWIESGLLCDHTKKKFKLEDCSSCYNLLLPQTKKEKQDIIRNLEQAVMLLEKQDLHELIPEVRMNIAMATTSATVKEDVASIPGRLIAIDNRLKALMKPRFGTSHFLSALLLQIKEHSPETNAIINFKYNNQVKSCWISTNSSI